MIGVVADDTTGANDIGIMFSNNGYLTKIVIFEEQLVLEKDAEISIIDTDSRLDRRDRAYEKVFAATNILKRSGCDCFYKKTCSVFRGNIGSEFDAMLDALNEKFMVVSLAFPRNGRQTVHGIHFVHGRTLEESEFANDPVHPMRDSDLVRILQQQTTRAVGLIDIGVVRQGPERLRQALQEAQLKYDYCIVDGENQNDLKVLAQAVQGLPVLGGSSALAEELPKFWPGHQAVDVLKQLQIKDENGILVVAGSLTPQTMAQTAYLQAAGFPCLVLDSREIFEPAAFGQAKQMIVNKAKKWLTSGSDVLIMADNSPAVVDETKTLGKELGIDPMVVSKMVSAALAEIVAEVVETTGLKRLVIAGGDTAGTICRKLGIKGNIVLREIEAGLPSGYALGRPMLIVLKSGSFGRPNFLQNAVDHLKALS